MVSARSAGAGPGKSTWASGGRRQAGGLGQRGRLSQGAGFLHGARLGQNCMEGLQPPAGLLRQPAMSGRLVRITELPLVDLGQPAMGGDIARILREGQPQGVHSLRGASHVASAAPSRKCPCGLK